MTSIAGEFFIKCIWTGLQAGYARGIMHRNKTGEVMHDRNAPAPLPQDSPRADACWGLE